MVNSSTLLLKSNIKHSAASKWHPLLKVLYVRILVENNNKNHLKYRQNGKK